MYLSKLIYDELGMSNSYTNVLINLGWLSSKILNFLQHLINDIKYKLLSKTIYYLTKSIYYKIY